MARSKYTEVEQRLMKEIAANLRRISDLKGLTQTQISEKTGLSTSTISDYFNAVSLISPGNLQKLADALNVSKADIDTSIVRATSKAIPLVGTICAGNGFLVEQNIEDYVYYPFLNKKLPDYALRVQGDSMVDAGIEPGDIVYLRHAQWADYNGQIVVAIINDDQDGTLKRMKWTENSPTIQLVPENKLYPAIEVLPNALRICGVYMGHFKPERNDI